MLKNLINVFRRLHRIFAHAWFQHRGVFWSVESQTGLYVFFKAVCDLYDLLPAENYKLPPEAEGLESEASNKEEKRHVIAKQPTHHNDTAEHEDDRNSLHARRNNTARHSSRPSTGSAVTTVLEEGEDEHPDVTAKLKGMHISAPDTVEEASEVEVPVIVEEGMIDASTVESSEHTGDRDDTQGDSTSENTENTKREPETVQDMALPDQELLPEPAGQGEEPQQTAGTNDQQGPPDAADTPPTEAPASATAENSEEAVEQSPEEEGKPATENPSMG